MRALLVAPRARTRRRRDPGVGDVDSASRDPLLNFFMTRYIKACANAIAALVAALEAARPIMTPSAEDGLKALAMAEAVAQSAATGRRVEIGC